MVYHLLSIGVLAGLAIFNYRHARRNVLYPPFLFCMIWVSVLSLYFLLYLVPIIHMSTLHVYTLFVVLAASVVFSLGGMVIRRRYYVSPAVVLNDKKSIYKKILFFCCLGLLPFFFLEIRRLSALGGIDGFLASARVGLVEELTNGRSAFGGTLTTIAPLLAIFLAFIFVIEVRDWREERVWIAVSVFIAIVFCVLTTGRAGFLKLLVGLAGIYLLKTGRFSAKDAWKLLRWPLLIFVLIFTTLVPLTKNISNTDETLTEAIAQFSVGYAVLPLAGFDYVVDHIEEYKYTPNFTLRELTAIAGHLPGVSSTPQEEPNDFLLVPLFTNVYTAISRYYIDFGLSGTLMAMFVFGLGQTWLFWRAVRGDPFYVFLFAITLYPLGMIAFDDTYTLFSHYFAELVFAIVYFRLLRMPVARGINGQSSGGLASTEVAY